MAGVDSSATIGQTDESQQLLTSWLTSLQLVAVQPACLKAHQDTPTQNLDAHDVQHAADAGVQPGQEHQQQHFLQLPLQDLQHHDLLLQFQATLTRHAPPAHRQPLFEGHQLQVSAITAGATMASCSLLPLPVQKAVLQVVLLNRHMQVLLHKQYSLSELLQQQQHIFLTNRSQTDPQAEPTSSSHVMSTSTSRQQEGQQERALHFNIQLSAPCQQSAYVLDALHLFVTLCSAELADPSLDTDGPQAACLVAELPLLVMPAQAQQEVQQLLLPAMRQDVQTDQFQTDQQQPDQEGQQLHLTAADIALHAVHVEQAVWQHFNQLALDILLIMQLSEAVRAEAAHAACAVASSVAGSQPDSPSAAAAASGPAAGGDLQQHQEQQQPGGPAVASNSSAMDNLLQAVNTLLLPLLLPFLTAHSLHNTLQVLLQCLPPQLQLQQHWQQQQLERLEALAALPLPPVQDEEEVGLPGAASANVNPAADSVVVSSAMLDTPAVPQPASAAAPAAAAEYAMSGSSESLYESGRSSPAEDWEACALEQQCVSGVGSSRSSSHQLSRVRLESSHQEGSQADSPAWPGPETPPGGSGSVRRRGGRSQGAAADVLRGGSDEPAGRGRDPDSSRGIGGGDGRGFGGWSRQQLAVRYQLGVLTAATGMPCWIVPFMQFADSDLERRYLAWKHEKLLYVDVLGGIYTVAIALSLTKPVLFQHPATWVLLTMTLVKGLPHVPLMLGYRQQHLRYRELWMFLGAPSIGLLLVFLVLATTAWQPANMPPMPLAYRSFWRMHGELITAALRAFFQHMRLRPFIIYTLVDRVVSMQLWAPWSGVRAAVGRSTLAGVVSLVVCWALELCFRRRFVLAGLYRPQQHRRAMNT